MLRWHLCRAGGLGLQQFGAAIVGGLAGFLAAVLLSISSGSALAQVQPDPAAQATQQQLEQWRREINQRAQVLTVPAEQRWAEPVAGEQPCFVIERFTLSPVDAQDGRYDWLLHKLGKFPGACLGLASIEALRSNLQARLVAAGYVTSRVLVPEQDLATGQLQFSLQLGRVEQILFVATGTSGHTTSMPGPAGTALALRTGEVLNLRQIEQSLENLARLPSMAAQFRIEPGRLPGSSHVLIALPGTRAWQAAIGLDTTDSKEFGPLQLSARMRLDSPFGLADQFSAVVSVSSRSGDGRRPGQASLLLNHSLPLGRHLVWANLSQTRFQREVVGGVSRFEERGVDSQAQLRWQVMAWRDQATRLSLWAGGTARLARTWLDDTELLLRRRSAASADLGLALWRRHACGQWSAELDLARTVRLKREVLFQPDPAALPLSWRTQLHWGCDLAGALTPSGTADGPGRWTWDGRLLLQGVNHPFGGADLVSIGSRWTVRGHSAGHGLSGEGMQLLRQELLAPTWPLSATGAARPFVGFDLGRIQKPLVAVAGQSSSLSAIALGLRWNLVGSSGELVAARPLRRLQPVQGVVVFGGVNHSF